MARYADGDAPAFDELFRRYEGRAYAFLLERTRSRERARDLYQELFLRLHRSRDRFDASRPFPPWFFQIAHRLAIDERRRAFWSREVPAESRDPLVEHRTSEAQVADREQASRLLDALSSEERYVVLSARIEGVGYAELAARLGRSAAAVRKLASRATRRLRGAAAAATALADRTR
jgi:RNA polymerase sigma-70 factor (ECF subfamily)